MARSCDDELGRGQGIDGRNVLRSGIAFVSQSRSQDIAVQIPHQSISRHFARTLAAAIE